MWRFFLVAASKVIADMPLFFLFEIVVGRFIRFGQTISCVSIPAEVGICAHSSILKCLVQLRNKNYLTFLKEEMIELEFLLWFDLSGLEMKALLHYISLMVENENNRKAHTHTCSSAS